MDYLPGRHREALLLSYPSPIERRCPPFKQERVSLPWWNQVPPFRPWVLIISPLLRRTVLWPEGSQELPLHAILP